jgi:hypothetical protein
VRTAEKYFFQNKGKYNLTVVTLSMPHKNRGSGVRRRGSTGKEKAGSQGSSQKTKTIGKLYVNLETFCKCP